MSCRGKKTDGAKRRKASGAQNVREPGEGVVGGGGSLQGNGKQQKPGPEFSRKGPRVKKEIDLRGEGGRNEKWKKNLGGKKPRPRG